MLRHVPQTLREIGLCGKKYMADGYTNIPAGVMEKVSLPMTMKLHQRKSGPISLILQKVKEYCLFQHPLYINREMVCSSLLTDRCAKNGVLDGDGFLVAYYDAQSPVVTLEENFDSLCFPSDHPSRSSSDSYYVNRHQLLRTHMTAHTSELLRKHDHAYISVGDVYRRDEIDAIHLPVFHQMDMVRRFTRHEIAVLEAAVPLLPKSQTMELDKCVDDISRFFPLSKSKDLVIFGWIVMHMKRELEFLVHHIFSRMNVSLEWMCGDFPFTYPSFELEVVFPSQRRVELLGCGILKPSIVEQSNSVYFSEYAWAVGLGLERLAMTMFDIPDIRLFWSTDERFTTQFSTLDDRFKPFSKYPPVYRDLSFWTGAEFNENMFMDIVREAGEDVVESVKLVDRFVGKDGRLSLCYRMAFRSFSASLCDKKVNEMQSEIVGRLVSRLDVVPR